MNESHAPHDDDLPPLVETPPGRYRHYKGGEYEVIGTVRHSETLEPMTLYRALYGQRGLWVRPAAMFEETVDWQGAIRPRFAKLAGPAAAGTLNRSERPSPDPAG